MSELVLVKIPVHVEATAEHPAADAERVIGVALDQTPTVLEHGYRSNGSESEEAINFPSSTSERIADFYARTIALDPEKQPYYDCLLFTFYALGKALNVKEHEVLYIDELHPLPAGAGLEPGEAYATTTTDGTLNHAMLGIARPTHNLSVIGVNMPMLVARNDEILNLYEANRINHMYTGDAVE